MARGARLGPYEIVAPVGAGGMGEVYRARDTRLGRDVALKVLPEELASDSERLKRFEKEARAASSLNHPHIVTVFDVGREGSISWLAMELVEGSTLKELLAEGPFSAKKALAIAADMAGGLARAHAAGIVHRDLKPENVMIGRDGLVKLLDFGLVKLTRPESEEGLGKKAATVPEPSAAGIVKGTVGYMSPEQACGEPVDFRSDQFSFGSVLYEMLTGRRAFSGASAPQTLAAIIEREPEPILSANPRVPPPVRWIVERCLAKDPKSRYASTEDLARELATVRDRFSELVGTGEQPQALGPMRRAGNKGLLLASVVIVAAAAGLLIGLLRHRESPEPRTVARFSIDLQPLYSPEGVADVQLAMSPDGSRLAWVIGKEDRDRVIKLRRLDERDATPLAGTEGARNPFFSPDGESLAFFSAGKLKKISLAGGASVTLCDVGEPVMGTWGADGQIYFSYERSPIWRVPAAGGAATAFTTLAKGELSHGGPETLPGSNALVFTVMTGSGWNIAALAPGSRVKRVLMKNAWAARYAAGHLVFARLEGAAATLFAGPFDVASLEWKGAVVPLLEGVRLRNNAGSDLYDVSRSGTLLYCPALPQFDNGVLVRVDRKGGEKRLTERPSALHSPRLSPDGTRVAVSIGPNVAKRDVWIYEIERGTLTRLTHNGKSGYPIWTPDGKKVCFDSLATNFQFDIFCQRADGSREAELLLESLEDKVPYSISPDGAWLAFSEFNPRTNADMWLFPLSGGGPAKLLMATPYNELGAQFSPDGRWLAYLSDESGRYEVYLQGFPGPSARWQISADGGSEPTWSHDGRELFYRQGDRMMSVPIGTSSASKAGTPRVLFQGKYAAGLPGQNDYCVTADGEGFVMVKPVDSGASSARLEVVLNWVEELKRLSSAANSRR